VASSDIDLLVVARLASISMIQRSDAKTRILEEAGLPLVHPFERSKFTSSIFRVCS